MKVDIHLQTKWFANSSETGFQNFLVFVKKTDRNWFAMHGLQTVPACLQVATRYAKSHILRTSYILR